MAKKMLCCFVSGVLLVALLVMVIAVPKAEARKIRTEKYEMVYVACGETYKISRLAKGKSGADPGMALAKKIKGKKVTWSSSSKNLVIKNKTIRAKKPGNYRLVGKTKKKKFVLPVSAANKNRSRDYSQVSYAIIVSGNTGGRVKVESEAEVRAICQKIDQSKYTFNYEGSGLQPAGWVYSIQLYSADNVLIDGLNTGATYDDFFCFVCKYPDILQNYVEQLYNKYPKIAMQ